MSEKENARGDVGSGAGRRGAGGGSVREMVEEKKEFTGGEPVCEASEQMLV